MRRVIQILPYLCLPIVAGICLLSIIVALIALMLTPEGLNPAEGLVLRIYLLREDSNLNSAAGTDANPRRFEVEANDTANSIGIRLVTQGFISNGTLFARYVQYEGLDTQLREGTFFLNETLTIPEIAHILTDPTPQIARLTVIEGWRMEQIADALNNLTILDFSGNDFLAVVGAGAPLPPDFQQRHGIPSGVSLEGFLFPATYEISVAATANEFRDQMLEAFDRNVNVTLRQDANARGWSMFQVVTLASIVEREAVLMAERPQIASVYLNRYNIGQKLDADPTTQYALGNSRDGNWWPRITQADYQFSHPYNTYMNVGLPPGPIANPSVSAIRAVIYPADTPYFYFRAACSGTGEHDFSVTYEEHLNKSC